MAESLTLKTNNQPSYFNKDTLLGGMGGFLAGAILLNTLVPGAGLIGAAAGALIGGALGKNRIEHENKEGKQVGEPSALNKEAAIGGMIGLALAGVVALAAGFMTVGVGAAIGLSHAAIGGTTLAAVGASVVGAPVVGAWLGGKIGKAGQAAELEEAKKQTIVRHLNENVSPDVASAVEYSMTHSKDWAKSATEKRMLDMAQGRTP